MKIQSLISVLLVLSAVPSMASESSYVDDVLSNNVGQRAGNSPDAGSDCAMHISEEGYGNYEITLATGNQLAIFKSDGFEASRNGARNIVYSGFRGDGVTKYIGRPGLKSKISVDLKVNARRDIVGFTLQDGPNEESCYF